ncbi:unnamed protein product [Polarella glacialis]|uniref:EF-hand domain-containing protein n=1 Tax=Polarella glacialis TaxID=89957 RepID=A0A813IH31_POLGL|nr:unnamed protein product [Polarella glacialis]
MTTPRSSVSAVGLGTPRASNVSSPLQRGAEAMLLGKTTPAARAAEKRALTCARPPPRSQPEAMSPAGKSTGIHPPGATGPVAVPTEAAGSEVEHAGQSRRLCEGSIYGGAPVFEEMTNHLPSEDGALDDETARFVRQFVSRARGRGAHRLPRLALLLRNASSLGTSGKEELSQLDFTPVTMAEGLCRSYHECERVFRHFARGRQSVPVDALITVARGSLESGRAAIVREVWSQLDPQGKGSVQVLDLLEMFDIRRLPDVRFGRQDVEGARRELLEGMNASLSGGPDRSNDYALEESAACRRPRPVGDPSGGGPVSAPAGRPDVRFRSTGDARSEVAGRPPAFNPDAQISIGDFEAYWTAMSSGIPQDEVFEQTLRSPLTNYQAHGKAQAERLRIHPPHGGLKPCNLRLFGTFGDGSQRVLVLRNDEGLEHLSAAAGTGDGQFWTWGPKVQGEVVRRLQADGFIGLKSVQLRPF